jgi:uncharacterized protein (DUF1810 family)
MDIYSLNRFIEAQENMYDIALEEIKNGEKCSHWMWYIFPQLRGLGYSYMSHVYGVDGLTEAREYLADPILSARLIEISEVLLAHKDKSAYDIFGDVDEMKLQSSMTLFALASDEDSIFHQVLDCFYNGEMDPITVEKVRWR